YIQLVRRELANVRGYKELSTGDTLVSTDSLDAALSASGGVLNAVDAVMTGKVKNAFCAVRPPGHHAGTARGMGFCIVNNVAIARVVVNLADELCQGRVVSVLEGGYRLDGLADSVAAHVRVLQGK